MWMLSEACRETCVGVRRRRVFFWGAANHCQSIIWKVRCMLEALQGPETRRSILFFIGSRKNSTWGLWRSYPTTENISQYLYDWGAPGSGKVDDTCFLLCWLEFTMELEHIYIIYRELALEVLTNIKRCSLKLYIWSQLRYIEVEFWELIYSHQIQMSLKVMRLKVCALSSELLRITIDSRFTRVDAPIWLVIAAQ